ncbi:uncharacterized protein LOC110461892 isoform X1 [Mizuhopecten yessoensis]|uniref:uncharacterized protein LOC110461892 isoform X1 n=1 Tax=Mizuhopecten yessoensis TaxID=6573 RepID=UPI000B45D22A|nr:uncharacterized protein LOC110461892 isoform X1 [Mizuhopecten yessoensis]
MATRIGKKTRKCKQCKGDICIHENAKQKECLPFGPSIAEQCMEILDKLLKDKEGTPEDILKLATHDQLFQIGMDPLCLVAAMGNVDVMRRFLDAGSNVNVRSTADASTPLMLATQNRHTEMAELLLKHGADVTAVNMEKNNSFCIAVRTGDAKLVNAIWPYRGKLDINHANSEGQTVLHFAAEKLWEACVGFLLTNGAQINRQNGEGFTPLMIAASKGDAKTVEKFLSSGADFLIEDVTGMTAVCWAFDSQKFDSFNLILGKMSPKDKEHFIKSRTERMKNPSCEHDSESDIAFYEDILIPMFKRLATIKDFRDAILKQKFIPSAVSVFTKLMKQPACITGICFVVSLCMTQHAVVVDEAVVIQFIRCRGPEFLIKALKCFSDTPRTEPETCVVCFFPLACMGQTSEGKEWLEKNSTKVIQHVDVKPHYNTAKTAMESFGDKGVAIWTNFWDYYEKMTQYQMDRKMAELLEEEERERVLKTKKREKKIQKRQTKRQQRKDVQATVAKTEEMKGVTMASDQSHGKNIGEITNIVNNVEPISRRPQTTYNDIPNKHDNRSINDVIINSRKPHVPSKQANDDVITISKKPIVPIKQVQDDVIVISKRPPVEFKNKQETNRKGISDISFGNVPNSEHGDDISFMLQMEMAALQGVIDPCLYDFYNVRRENQWVTVQGKKERAKANKAVEEVMEAVPGLCQKLESALEDQIDEVKKDDIRQRPNQRQRRANKGNNGPRWADMVKGNEIPEKEPEPVRHIQGTYADRVVGKAYEDNFPALGGMPHVRGEQKKCEQQLPPGQMEQQSLCNVATAVESTTTDSEDLRSEFTSTDSVADGDCGRMTPSSGYNDNKAVTDCSSPIHCGDIYVSPTNDARLEYELEVCPQQKDASLIANTRSERTTNLFDIAESVLFEKKCTNIEEPKANNTQKTDFLGLPIRSGEHNFEFLSSAKTLTPNEWNLEEVVQRPKNADTAEQNEGNLEKGKGDAREEYFPELEKRGFSDAVQDWLKNSCILLDSKTKTNKEPLEDQLRTPAMLLQHIQGLQQTQLTKLPCGKRKYNAGELKHNPFQKDASVNQLPFIQHQQEFKHNIAVIQPIGHGSNRRKATERNVSRRHVEGLDNGDHSHLSFGDSLLRNVSTLPKEKDEIWFPSDLAGDGCPEKKDNYSINASDMGNDLPVFPGFHDDTNPSASGVPSQQNMDVLLQLQLLNYYQVHCKGQGIKGSVYGNDLAYFSSAMGISEEKIKSLEKVFSSSDVDTRVAQQNQHDAVTTKKVDRQVPLGRNATIHHDPDIDMSLGKGLRPTNIPEPAKEIKATRQVEEHADSRHIVEKRIPDSSKSFVRNIPGTEINDGTNMGYKEKGTFQEEMRKGFVKTNAIKWTQRSKRWKDKLSEISKMPPSFLRQIGDIIIPRDYKERYTIPYSDSPAVLGLLMDGTEVAVHVIELSSRPVTESMLQKLTSPDFCHYFLVKYRAFIIESGTCYLAMDLHEYNLSEYLALQQMDINLDPLTINKMTWQILKGMASLHDSFDMIHGNIMPSNVLVDVEEKLCLSEYSLPTLGGTARALFPTSPMSADRYCWIPTEIVTESGNYSKQSDIQVTGMLSYYIMTGGNHPYGENNLAIQVGIHQNWPDIKYLGDEIHDLLSNMLCMPPQNRSCVGDLLKHPYFWANEKRLRFVLIAGSDVLRDMKLGVPTFGGTGGTMIDIINAVGCDANDWMSQVDPVIMKEMRSFRQYKNTLVELVLFVYNCCLHFEKMSEEARDVLDEPCKYFLSKFPTLFMSVFSAIKSSDRSEKICYKPFF